MKHTILSILTFIFLNIVATAHAYSWPRFSAPDKTMLIALGAIDTKGCPPGQGRQVPDFSINIRDNVCRSFCPRSWAWSVHGDNACHSLATEFEFKGFDIAYSYDEDGLVDRSIVKANYGANSLFQLRFESEQEEHWYCIKVNESVNQIECANDI